jgi:predicted O-linked N-acetylglucosamine transferase (SPINDLY family)
MNEQLLRTARGLHQAGRIAEAERLYLEVLRHDPRNVSALLLLGYSQLRRGASLDALAQFDGALAVDPNNGDALGARGAALCSLQRHAEAVASFDRSIAIRPGVPQVHNNRGNALLALGRGPEAVGNYDRAVRLDPAYVDAWRNRGIALLGLAEWNQALESFRQAMQHGPESAVAWEGSATALVQLDRRAEAIAAYDRAIVLRGATPELLYNRGNTQAVLKNYDAAVRDCESLLAVAPDYPYARGVLAHAKMQICDWRGLEIQMQQIEHALRAGKRVISPFNLKALSDSAELQLASARLWVQHECPPAATPLARGGYRHKRIRIAYVSGDFGNTAVGGLMAPVFALHDHERFETIAVSFGPPERSELRTRLEGSFDRFVELAAKSDDEIAARIRESEIDIAVDLMGFTGHCRSAIFARRPAPVQVNFIGFPGSLGAPYIDYIIGDSTVIPAGQECFYSEKVARLPHCYLPADPERLRLPARPTREQAGLPADAVVFASFNNSYKFSPVVFACWMRILQAIEDSVLWLPENNAAARASLRREAAAQGIAPERLTFAPPVPGTQEHLTRLSLADIFLDTAPYNSHSTALDALSARVPIITVVGNSFASRVAASILRAAGFPEFVADSLPTYERLAIELARDPRALTSAKDRLASRLPRSPLFDVVKFSRDLEAAYASMWHRAEAGEAPQTFAVPA